MLWHAKVKAVKAKVARLKRVAAAKNNPIRRDEYV